MLSGEMVYCLFMKAAVLLSPTNQKDIGNGYY